MNNSTCSYCGSSLASDLFTKIDKIYCGFCEMFVTPSKDGERVENHVKQQITGYDQVRMTTPELLEMNTKSLLELLRFMREERRSYFNHMRILKRAASDDPGQFGEGEKMSSEEYEMITRKCFVVENILRDRMGYIPKKITDHLLMAYEQRVSDPYNYRPMIIRGPRQAKEKVSQRG
ncbi:hypothetical protein [Bacillus xiapuensis]|uniref:Uncharacterized protein n=1 Tax=Bacillus xiapuensis TaxID=2014075 RepID=A0ABU6N5J6_9BACI|nr:hypothetical protein [Bacillus xiapuensis]